MFKCISFFLITFVWMNCPSVLAEKYTDFSLLDQNGKFHKMSWYDDHSIIAFAAFDTEVRTLINNLRNLQKMSKHFGPQKIICFMLMSDSSIDDSEIIITANNLNIDIPILIDRNGIVARELGIKKRSTVTLIDPKNREILLATDFSDAFIAPIEDILTLRHKELELSKNSKKGELRSDYREYISYSTDIAPILINKCTKCHHDGGIGPFALDSYQSVKGWSPMIKEVVLTKRMPPGQIDITRGHSIQDPANLTDSEEKILINWINEGATFSGDEDPLTNLTWPKSDWPFGQPDLVIDIPEQIIPASGVIDYKFIDVDVGLLKDRWVQGSVMLPGQPTALHHVVTTVLTPEQQKGAVYFDTLLNIADSTDPETAEKIQRKVNAILSGKEEFVAPEVFKLLPPGTDMGLFYVGENKDVTIINGYAPGMAPKLNEAGHGGVLKAGSKLHLSMHYTPVGKEVVDRSRIGIYLYPEGEIPPKRYGIGVGASYKINIPPQSKEHLIDNFIQVNENVSLVAVMPHMHYRGKWVKFFVQHPNKKEDLLLSIPNYSFNWQYIYYFEEPITIPKGSKLITRGAFDNSSQNVFNPDPNQTVHWGEFSNDEMFQGFYLWKLSDSNIYIE